MSTNQQGNSIVDYIKNFKWNINDINKYLTFPEDEANIPREITIGFKIDGRQLEFITWWTYFFYNQRVIDDETKQQHPIIEKISPSMLAKLSIKAFIYNWIAYQRMQQQAIQAQMAQQQKQQPPGQPQQPQNPNQFRYPNQ